VQGLLEVSAKPGARDGSRIMLKPGGALGDAVASELDARLARLRWRHALAILGTRTRK
jgi:hypothetical protein